MHFTFAPFDAVRFHTCMVDGQPIGTLPRVVYDLATKKGVIEAATSVIGDDRASFSVMCR